MLVCWVFFGFFFRGGWGLGLGWWEGRVCPRPTVTSTTAAEGIINNMRTRLGAVHEPVDGLVEEVLDARAHARHQVHGAAQRGERAGDGQDLWWWLCVGGGG